MQLFTPTRCKPAIGRSQDGGKTWQFSEGIVDWDWPRFGEVSSLRLSDGRLLAALRRQIPGTKGEGLQDTMITQSEDDGKTWATPWQMSGTAEVHAYLTKLRREVLQCAGDGRRGREGTDSVDSQGLWNHEEDAAEGRTVSLDEERHLREEAEEIRESTEEDQRGEEKRLTFIIVVQGDGNQPPTEI